MTAAPPVSDNLAARLDDVLHVVGDPVGVGALQRIGCSAMPLQSIEGIVRTAAIRDADPVLLVGTVDPELRARLADIGADVWLLEDAHPAIALAGLAEKGEDQADALAVAWRTWQAYVERACRDTVPPPMVEEDGLLIEAIEPKRIVRDSWPAPLHSSVRLGALGSLLDIVENQTEADPAAIAFDFLARVGSLVGRGPHVRISGDRHGTNLFVLLVGDTAQGRKGTSAAYPQQVASRADTAWRPRSGLASGEGLIHAVRDERDTGRTDSDGNAIIEEGVSDKRLLVVEAEFARVLRTSARRENTLSPLLRQAWEGSSLATMTRQPYQATDPHISIIGHVTRAELTSLLSANDIAGGTGNRFLLVASRRQRELPFGGDVPDHVLDDLGRQLSDVVSFASCNGAMGFTPAAAERWPDDYRLLLEDERKPGIAGSMLGRGAAQVRRLSMLMGVLERRRDVDAHHVGAAMELWRYCRETVHHVFGIRTGSAMADRLHDEMKIADGGEMDRSQIRRVFPNAPAADIEAALAVLYDAGIAAGRKESTGKPGKPREVWRLLWHEQIANGGKGANPPNRFRRTEGH